ncbi:MAG TPA: dienelactone hydrolase family protein [Acidimicrobiales bacterium]|nr:dienelactone hydrolase family protein [Acidimicrobiales bacterium]
MAEVVLFHHAQGLTAGTLTFTERLRGAGHTVHLPDLYEGRVFASLDEGVAFARSVGFDVLLDRGVRYAEELSRNVVYAGISLGALPAQQLAQTRAGAKGALLMSAAFPPLEFGVDWPAEVSVQIHMKRDDEWVLEGDLDAARDLAATVDAATLYLYPGTQHLFMDSSLRDYDESAATRLTNRVLSFLERVG